MHVALGICVLMAGGWYLPESSDQADLAPVPRVGQYGAVPNDLSTRQKMDELSNLPNTSPVARGQQRGAGGASISGGAGGPYGPAPRHPSGYLGGGAARGMMPMVPTDPAAREWFLAPTDYGPGGARPTRPGGNGGGYANNFPRSPGLGRSGGFNNPMQQPMAVPTPFTSMESQNSQYQPAQIGGAPAGMPSSNGLAASRPFSGYKPAPAVSPWLNLYRTDNAGGTIDNYNTVVKPYLDQMQQNQQYDNQISGLQTTVAPLVPPQRQPGQQGSPIPSSSDMNGQSNPNYTGGAPQP